MESVLKKFSEGKLEEVKKSAKKRISKNNEDAEGWFLLGLVSHEKGNESYALDCFERATYLKSTEKYHKAKGMAHMALFEFDEAAEEMKEALEFKNDAESHFMLAMALMFLDDADAGKHLEESHRLKPKKTRKMLRHFYETFFKEDPDIPEREKKMLREKFGL
ncbi:MAG: tetratricopeptide repeat protein [Candidatus Micrarchaeia archaeon]